MTAVITGGARGIGFAVAERLARAGVRVALWDLDRARAEDDAPDGGKLEAHGSLLLSAKGVWNGCPGPLLRGEGWRAVAAQAPYSTAC